MTRATSNEGCFTTQIECGAFDTVIVLSGIYQSMTTTRPSRKVMKRYPNTKCQFKNEVPVSTAVINTCGKNIPAHTINCVSGGVVLREKLVDGLLQINKSVTGKVVGMECITGTTRQTYAKYAKQHLTSPKQIIIVEDCDI